MKVNQSKIERIARVAAGLAILKKSTSLKTKAIGLVPLVTGLTGYCPAKGKLLGTNQDKNCGKCCGNDKKSDTPNNQQAAGKLDEATTA